MVTWTVRATCDKCGKVTGIDSHGALPATVVIYLLAKEGWVVYFTGRKKYSARCPDCKNQKMSK